MARPNLNGVRVHAIVTRKQYEALQKLHQETGVNASEHIRRALDFYMAKVASALYASGPKSDR